MRSVCELLPTDPGQPGAMPRLRAVPCADQPRPLRAAVCQACAGHAETYLCRRCGEPAEDFARGTCTRCALGERVIEVLGEKASGNLAPIRDALCGAGNPKSVLTWLYRSNSARMLADLARHDGSLTHELIDAFPRGQARSQLRQALVHAGVLPARQELIEDVEAWLGNQLVGVPPQPEDQRWQKLQRFLHDPVLPHQVRVAGALLLLYGHPISRTVQMEAAQLSHANGNTYLAFGQHPVLLPPVLAQLIEELHATATPTAVLGGRGSPNSWLFPGQAPSRHMSVNGLVRQLNHHGIQARLSRSAALINLAADLPAAVLADLIGMQINTAVRWAHRAKRDWVSYLAARSAGNRATSVRARDAELLPVVASWYECGTGPSGRPGRTSPRDSSAGPRAQCEHSGPCSMGAVDQNACCPAANAP